MTNKMKRFLTAMMVLVISISMFIIPAQAAGDYTPEVTIPVTVKLSGTLPNTPETFRIQLEAVNPSTPMPAGAEGGKYTLSVSAPKNADGTPGNVATGAFQIEYNKLGIYTYTVKQLPPANEDCYPDGREYNMTVYVTNTKNYDGFETTVAIYLRGEDGANDGSKCELEFANRYANPVKVDLSAIKTMDRKTPKDKAFTFKLVDADGDVVERVQNIGQKVDFTTLVFDKVGTYTYKISEQKGLSLKITYDKTVYTATIEVSKDADGNYQAVTTYKKGTADYTGTPTFKNYTKTDNPTTGDMFRLGLWISLLVLSFAGLVVLVVFWIRKRKK